MCLARVFGLFSGALLPLFLTYIFWPDLAHLPPDLACMFGLICLMFVWPGLAHVCRLLWRASDNVCLHDYSLAKANFQPLLLLGATFFSIRQKSSVFDSV